ncbi:hypothetical protein EYR40_007452 [Pleurotus pulmonarius]|nr:hypothetical protein EYR38_008249 [Pleurotus pulmonarius]KAF4597002.1 hypothetical protein EYR40_007452 [Pleurotus pulmonarius]
MPASPPLKLSFNLDDKWPKNVQITEKDHVETLYTMYNQLSLQSREAPWYGLLVGTIMPHLRAIYSSADGNVGLDTYPQYELHYSTGYTREELDRIRDPSWTPDHQAHERPEVQGIPEAQGKDKNGLPKEVKRLLDHGLDGQKWDTSDIVGTRSQMRAAAKVAEEASVDPAGSISTSTTSTAPEDISVHAIRVTDAMFLIRASLDLYRTFFPDANVVPRFPAIAFELKVPKAQTLEDDVTDRTITRRFASIAIYSAMPQIVQQAQFVFHMWSTLQIFWVVTACGRWARFHKFQRDRTPPINPTTVCHQEYYTPGPIAALLVPSKASSVVPIIDNTDGQYSDEFKALFKEAIQDATNEYNTFILSSIPK